MIHLHLSKYNGNNQKLHRVFIRIVETAGLLLLFDTLSRFEGRPGTVFPLLSHTGSFFVFLLSPLLPSFWFLYVDYQIARKNKNHVPAHVVMLAVNIVNAVIVMFTPFTGWYYFIDAGNVYHRGPLFFLSPTMAIALLLAAALLIVRNRAKIDAKYYRSLVFFAVPPFIGIFLNIRFYGFPVMLCCVTFSILVVFLNIQSRGMFTDYLTGVNNRMKLDVYLKEKIETSTAKKTFSAILLDIDNFKAINDTYGHDVGDEALAATVSLLKKCLRSEDFIARYGGDEFCIVLNISNKHSLKKTVSRISDAAFWYNQSSGRPYKLSFSMGCAVYDYRIRLTPDSFIKKLDRLMYQEKKENKDGGQKNSDQNTLYWSVK